MHSLLLLGLLGAASAAITLTCPDTNTFPFTVTVGDDPDTFKILAYGVDNPPITLLAGCEYKFELNIGTAVFHLKNDTGAGDANDITTTGNPGTGTDTITWTPSANSTFYYSTGSTTVYGEITVTDFTPSCAQYCSDYRLACTTDIYDSQAQCEAACASLPDDSSYTFAAGVTSQTRQCRMEQANCAASVCGVNPGIANNCANARFFNYNHDTNTLCGDNSDACSAYCYAAQAACPTSPGPLYSGLTQCRSLCGLFVSDNSPANADTWGCRAANVLDALLTPAACGAASVSGGDVCGSKCDVFCNAYSYAGCTPFLNDCPGTCSPYDSLPAGPLLVGASPVPSLECYIGSLYDALVTGDNAYCDYLSTCPFPSSSGISSSFLPSSSPPPSSSFNPSSSVGAASSSAAAESSSADNGGNNTSASSVVEAGVFSFVALVLTVLAM